MSTSRKLVWLLRHGLAERHLTFDPAGWVHLDEVLRTLGPRVSRDDIAQWAASDGKARFDLDGERVRACQGHSADMGLSLEALEASWSPCSGEPTVWHGTSVSAAEAILGDGIHQGTRTHVHLARSMTDRVGKRAGVAIGLEISIAGCRDDGYPAFVSPNGVVLVRRVPRAEIVGVRGATREGLRRESELRDRLATVD